MASGAEGWLLFRIDSRPKFGRRLPKPTFIEPASETMNASLRKKFDAVHREVVLLHFKWTYFLQLFGHKKGVDILNDATPALFKIIEDAMFFDITLTVMRLVDPPTTSGRANLSLRSLSREIDNATVRNEVERLEKEIRIRTKDIQLWRNRKMAHNDLDGHLAGVATLPSVQYADLFESIRLIRRAMKLLHSHYDDADFLYEECITHADGKLLLFYLRYGLDCWNDDKTKSDLSRWKKITKDINASLEGLKDVS
jgi:hypothetical protein